MDVQKTLGDRYELLEPIGRGGMATIYRANDTRMDRLVAIKVLREMYSSDPKFVLRFQREARAVSALAHPNIVQVFDYGQSGEAYYIVMELVDGIDLRRYLRHHGVLDVRRAVVIAHDVALGLGAAHRRGIVHRDVKPQNILVNDDGLVKLTDFGIATFYRDSQAERLTTTGMTLGTVQYYAPEQAQGEVVSPAADVYALGIVLYETLVGHPPFDGDTPVAIAVRHIQEQPVRPSRYNPNIPPTLERVILRCLEKDPRDRYRDGDVLAAALETYDKPRSSQPRMSAPMVAASGGPGYAPPPDPFGGRRNSGPRPASGPNMREDVPGLMPTRAETAAGTMPRSPAFPENPEERESSPVAGITTAIIVASVLVLLGVSCFLAFKLTPLGSIFSQGQTVTTSQISVPNLVGLTYSQAATTATNDHLVLLIGKQVVNSAPANTIINQTPPAGSKVAPNATITVDESLGPSNPVTVPDVRGETDTNACNDLQAKGFGCAVINLIASTIYQPGTVAKMSPTAGSQAQKGLIVDLWLSEGTPTLTPSPSPSPTATSSITPTSTPSVTATPTGTPTDTPTPSPTPP